MIIFASNDDDILNVKDKPNASGTKSYIKRHGVGGVGMRHGNLVIWHIRLHYSPIFSDVPYALDGLDSPRVVHESNQGWVVTPSSYIRVPDKR